MAIDLPTSTGTTRQRLRSRPRTRAMNSACNRPPTCAIEQLPLLMTDSCRFTLRPPEPQVGDLRKVYQRGSGRSSVPDRPIGAGGPAGVRSGGGTQHRRSPPRCDLLHPGRDRPVFAYERVFGYKLRVVTAL